MIVRGNKIYLWNELYSIVVVKYKHSYISGRSPAGGMKKFISFCSVKEAQTSYFRMNTHKVGEHFKKCI